MWFQLSSEEAWRRNPFVITLAHSYSSKFPIWWAIQESNLIVVGAFLSLLSLLSSHLLSALSPYFLPHSPQTRFLLYNPVLTSPSPAISQVYFSGFSIFFLHPNSECWSSPELMGPLIFFLSPWEISFYPPDKVSRQVNHHKYQPPADDLCLISLAPTLVNSMNFTPCHSGSEW